VRGNAIRSELKGRKQVDKKQAISSTRSRSLGLDSFALIGRRNFNYGNNFVAAVEDKLDHR